MLASRLSTASFAMTLAVLSDSALIRAQTTAPIVLDWKAPSGCPGAPEVWKRIRKLAKVWRPTGTPLQAEATITRTNEEQFHLRLIVRAGALVGERNIDAEACANLASAAAIHVALLLNQSAPLDERDLRGTEQTSYPDSGTGEAAPSSASPSSAEPEPSGSEATRTETDRELEPGDSRSAETSPRNWRLLVQVPLVSLQLGPLPQPSYGVSLAVGVRVAQWSLLADSHVWLQQRLELEGDPRFGADVDHIDVGVRICRAFGWARFELAPCLRVSLEHVWARGTGAHVAPQTARATWGAFGLGAQARVYVLEWLSVVVAVDAQLEASHPRILIDGVGSLGKLGPAAFALTLGSEWIF
jgi:hypothetical protein